MANLKIKTLLNAIAAKNEDDALVFEEGGDVVEFNDSTWNGEFTQDNIELIFGVNPSEAGLKGILAWLMLFLRNNDQRCLRLLKTNPDLKEIVTLIKFWTSTPSDASPAHQAISAYKLVEQIKRLRDAMSALGCWKEIGTFLKAIQELFKFNKKAMDLIRDGIKNLQQNLHDAFGGAFVANGQEQLAQQYASLHASSGISAGAACSIDYNSGSVDWALVGVIAGGVAIAAFLAGPPGGLAALLVGICGTANADGQAEGMIERAKQIMDRYNDLASSLETSVIDEEYVDDVIDPSGLSDVQDFDDQGNL